MPCASSSSSSLKKNNFRSLCVCVRGARVRACVRACAYVCIGCVYRCVWTIVCVNE